MVVADHSFYFSERRNIVKSTKWEKITQKEKSLAWIRANTGVFKTENKNDDADEMIESVADEEFSFSIGKENFEK